jgi:hypothetical protein
VDGEERSVAARRTEASVRETFGCSLPSGVADRDERDGDCPEGAAGEVNVHPSSGIVPKFMP